MIRVYLIGSLRNRKMIQRVAASLREASYEVFDDWLAPGPEADDKWKEYEEVRGRTYEEALKGFAAQQIFDFDHYHIHRSNIGILVLPCGKSGHLEFGYMLGLGKRAFILLPPQKELAKLPDDWRWLTGLYEGEGSITKNSKRGMALTVTSTDFDVIERLYKVSGVGRVQGPYLSSGNNFRKKPQSMKPQWRWSVYKEADVLYVLRGMWADLGVRRKRQILTTLIKVGLTEEHVHNEDEPSPWEFRYDVMYNFATDRFFSVEDMIERLPFHHHLPEDTPLDREPLKEHPIG